ncbi:MAG: AEC family transporter, partial [Burkholderiales bacterium]
MPASRWCGIDGRYAGAAATTHRMDSSVISALTPVVLLIAIGAIAGRSSWISAAATKDLSNLVFYLLLPGLLFRAMGNVDIARLALTPVAAFLLAALSIFFGVLLLRGFNAKAAVLGIATSYGNIVMIGIPLIGLLFGPAGLV